MEPFDAKPKAVMIRVAVKGGGDLGTGAILRLHRAGFRVWVTELPQPLAIRRAVAVASAIYEGAITIEGHTARRVTDPAEFPALWARGEIPVLVDPGGESIRQLRPEVVVDAIMAKRNTGTSIADAPVVVALGPGFTAGVDCHAVVETARGHDLGRVYYTGSAMPAHADRRYPPACHPDRTETPDLEASSNLPSGWLPVGQAGCHSGAEEPCREGGSPFI